MKSRSKSSWNAVQKFLISSGLEDNILCLYLTKIDGPCLTRQPLIPLNKSNLRLLVIILIIIYLYSVYSYTP